jgi:ADP-ribose pyrophosphatase
MTLVLPRPRTLPLERLSRRRVSDHGVFAVEEGTWRRRDGKTIGPIFTFECPDWCNVVALTPASELVLVWQYRFGTQSLTLELPGGVVDAGETALEAARRELGEETGYGAPTLTPLLATHANPALQGNVCHSFLAEGATVQGHPHFDDNEECEVVLVPLADAPALVEGGHVTHSLCVAAIQALLLQSDARRRGTSVDPKDSIGSRGSRSPRSPRRRQRPR